MRILAVLLLVPSVIMAQTYPTGPSTVTEGSITTFDDPVVILVFVFWGFCAVCLSAFRVYRRAAQIHNGARTGPVRARRDSKSSCDDAAAAAEMVSAVIVDDVDSSTGHVVDPDAPRKAPPSPTAANKANTCNGTPTIEEDAASKELEMQGFVDCAFGRVCAWLVIGMGLLWSVIFLTILFGYYNGCQFTGIDNAFYTASYPQAQEDDTPGSRILRVPG